MRRRHYRGEADVALLGAFNSAAIRETAHCGFLHPGDIAHHLFNGNRLFDPAEMLTIWETGGEVAAWVLVGPRHRGFDAQVRPDLRGGGFEREVLQYARSRTVELMRRHGLEADELYVQVYRCDTPRARLLTDLGWERDTEPPWLLNRARLDRMPEPDPPPGYTLRAAHGLEEAAALAEVHAASFGSTWTPELYRRVMQSPGYSPDRELVAQAADGTLAAFTVTWHDQPNRTGLFEPVGTHRDHRRRGLGRGLLLFGMRRMADAGMDRATVGNEGTNAASRGLYRSCGFEPWHQLDGYVTVAVRP